MLALKSTVTGYWRQLWDRVDEPSIVLFGFVVVVRSRLHSIMDTLAGTIRLAVL
jgi:hypothetical protein